MNDLYINYSAGSETLKQLDAGFHAALAAIDKVNAAHAKVKHKRGRRIKEGQPDNYVAATREREYEVALIRLDLDLRALFLAVRKLHDCKDAVRHMLDTFGYRDAGVSDALAKNNVMCAEELCEEGATLYYQTKQKEISEDRMAGYFFAIDRAYKQPPVDPDPREFVVMASGGGSAYRFEEGDGKQRPAAPYMTLAEAKADARHWCGSACTIGGDAQIYNVRTKEVINPFI